MGSNSVLHSFSFHWCVKVETATDDDFHFLCPSGSQMDVEFLGRNLYNECSYKDNLTVLFLFIDIYNESLPAIKALDSIIVKSKYFYDCIQSLELLNHEVKLIWVTGYLGIEDNVKAEECAAVATFLDETNEDPALLVDDWALKKVATRWSVIDFLRISDTLCLSDLVVFW